MLKIITATVAGFLATITGFICAYFYLQSLQYGNNLFFLIPVIPLIFIGVKLLIHASSLIQFAEKIPDPLAHLGEGNEPSTLDKNRQMIKEWEKTNDDQAKLKMLQLQSDEEPEPMG